MFLEREKPDYPVIKFWRKAAIKRDGKLFMLAPIPWPEMLQVRRAYSRFGLTLLGTPIYISRSDWRDEGDRKGNIVGVFPVPDRGLELVEVTVTVTFHGYSCVEEVPVDA
jgi:hypothetical protein